MNYEKIENKATIYADGAAWQESGSGFGGWGAVITEAGKEREIYGGEEFTTNNKMEMMACIKALESLSGKCSVVIFTDSKYLINGITSWIRGWKRNGWKTKAGDDVKNRDLWEKLDDLSKFHLITWNWIKGHSGVDGNERADQLAVRGKEEAKLAHRERISKAIKGEL